ncbi:MAG: glycosyltransferase family 1 protein [Gammaproteobacteria bacterium]
MKIAIVTDAWTPQVNGVVRTLNQTGHELTAMGHAIRYITPSGLRTSPCPTYPEIRLAMFAGEHVADTLHDFSPDAIHIATEGPLGQSARRFCLRRKLRFTTSFHTQFPEYIRARGVPLPLSWLYGWLRRFHGAAVRTMVLTPAQRERLLSYGFNNVTVWSRGVDAEVFKPLPRRSFDLPRPIAIYVGRVAVEKNLDAFLGLNTPGSKVIIGDGPALASMQVRYPGAHFLGALFGAELAAAIADGDVFVFPSRTDTFGLVMIEAMACGLPVAAYPVTGPIDVVKQGVSGCLHEDLSQAIAGALKLNREACVSYAQQYTWRRCTETFLSALSPVY